MKIVVAVRCMNGSRFIERFVHGYDFADLIVVSDGGSEDDSVSKWKQYDKVWLFRFDERKEVNGHVYNEDAPHMNFVLNKAKELEPDWLIFDDLDCWPNRSLRGWARYMFQVEEFPQVNVFRLYLWGETEYFPFMNRNFDSAYTSLWAWRPKEVDIHADENVQHGTLVGLHSNPHSLVIPYCLLHYSWSPDTMDEKIRHYNAMGLPFDHPFTFAGSPEKLPEWATS